jgi:head-tail adaptor
MRNVTIRVNNPVTNENLVDETISLDFEEDITAEMLIEIIEQHLDIELLENGKSTRGFVN